MQNLSSFFAHPISVRGQRTNGRINTTVNSVCVDDGDSDLTDSVTQKTVRLRTFFIRRCDWAEKTPPQCGDIITEESGDRFAVEKVCELQILGWNCAARQI